MSKSHNHPHDDQNPARQREQPLSPDIDFPDPPPEKGGQEPTGTTGTQSPGT